MGDHPPSRLNWTRSLHGTFLSPAAAEETACIAQDLLTDEWIGVGAHHDRSGVAAGRPTDQIAPRGVPVHPRRAVGPLRKAGNCCPCVRWGRYLVRASTGEARSVTRPRTEANNPIENDVVLSLARGMDSSIDSRPTPRSIWRPSPTHAS